MSKGLSWGVEETLLGIVFCLFVFFKIYIYQQKYIYLDFSVSSSHFCCWPWREAPLWSLSLLYPPAYHSRRKWAPARRGNKQSLLGWILVCCLFASLTKWHTGRNFLPSALIIKRSKKIEKKTKKKKVLKWNLCYFVNMLWADYYANINFYLVIFKLVMNLLLKKQKILDLISCVNWMKSERGLRSVLFYFSASFSVTYRFLFKLKLCIRRTEVQEH